MSGFFKLVSSCSPVFGKSPSGSSSEGSDAELHPLVTGTLKRRPRTTHNRTHSAPDFARPGSGFSPLPQKSSGNLVDVFTEIPSGSAVLVKQTIYSFNGKKTEVPSGTLHTVRRVGELMREGAPDPSEKMYFFGFMKPEDFPLLYRDRAQLELTQYVAEFSRKMKPKVGKDEMRELVVFVMGRGVPLISILKTTGKVTQNPVLADSDVSRRVWLQKYLFPYWETTDKEAYRKFIGYAFEVLGGNSYTREGEKDLRLELENIDHLFGHDGLRDARDSLVGKNPDMVRGMNGIFQAILDDVSMLQKLPQSESERNGVASEVLGRVESKLSAFNLGMDSGTFNTASCDVLKTLYVGSELEQMVASIPGRIKMEKVIVKRLVDAFIDWTLDFRATISIKECWREVVDEYRKYYESNIWEARNRLSSTEKIPLTVYTMNRKGTSAVRQTFVVGDAIRGLPSIPTLLKLEIHLDDTEKQEIESVFKRLDEHAEMHVFFTNDAFSFMREFKDGVRENCVRVYYEGSQRLDQSFKNTTDEINTHFDSFHREKKDLIVLLEKLRNARRLSQETYDKIVSKIEVRLDWMEGNREWSGDSPRYSAIKL